MESLLETLLTLVPIVLILALRIAASKKERQKSLDRAVVVEKLKSGAAKQTKVTHQKQEYKPAFKFDESAHPPIAQWEDIPQAKKVLSPSSFEMELSDFPVKPKTGVNKEAILATPIQKDPIKEEKGALFQSLAKLSGLQQAVVYAELLGPPKGLQP